jgi:hypothetical protein
MSKTIVSAFDSQKEATRLLASAIASGFDSRFFSLISPAEAEERPLDSLKQVVPSIQARVYWKHLQKGDSLLVAQVPEDDVARLIKLLQSTGGHHIEAFDQVNAA